MTDKATKPDASDGREASECSALLSSASEYIDALERRLAADFNDSWNWLRPTDNELAGKKGAWLANKSIAELKGR